MIVVGARVAGCAAAAPLARAGRRVLVLDRMRFPSDQLSTHVLMPAGVEELRRMGALERVAALRPTPVREVRIEVDGVACTERVRPCGRSDHGLCVPRDMLDVELVEAVRAQGAEVREGCHVESVIEHEGRVAGIGWRDPEGELRQARARLLIGADGRRSTVAALVGSWQPYRVSRNGRGLVFRYMDDPFPDSADASTYVQWREGSSIAFAFPTAPEGRLLVLLMGHRDEASAARRDPEGYWEQKLRAHPGLARRTAGAQNLSKVRSTAQTPAFFRASSGRGWALAGDAGHFKDPVTGQGMRDAMLAGRTLAESVLGVLDDPARLDLATRRWEAERDRECLPAYHFANSETRVQRQSPALRELVREAGRTRDPDITDLFGRARQPQEIATLPRLSRALGAALLRGDGRRGEALARGLADLGVELRVRQELRADVFRSPGPVRGSEHPGAEWPTEPRIAGSSPTPG